MTTLGCRDTTEAREPIDDMRVALAWLAGWVAGAAERRDPLTGLANRTAFFLRAERLLGSPCCENLTVALLDVNHFKAVNDTFGHGAGDQVLRHVADTLEVRAGVDGLVGRLAGDEFVALVPCPAGRSPAAVAAHLGRAMATPIDGVGGRLLMSLSVGIAPAGRALTAPLAELLGRADAALNRAKRSTDGIAVYDPIVDEYTVPIVCARPPIRIRDRHPAHQHSGMREPR